MANIDCLPSSVLNILPVLDSHDGVWGLPLSAVLGCLLGLTWKKW